MALRIEDLVAPARHARVYVFPTTHVRRRIARTRAARRRRTALTVVGLAVVAATLAGTAGGPATAIAGNHRVPRTVVVQPGDTLWDLATRFAPEGSDPRVYIDEITASNRLEGGLIAGARITLPR